MQITQVSCMTFESASHAVQSAGRALGASVEVYVVHSTIQLVERIIPFFEEQ